MVPKLASRNLFHDRLSLIVTLVGIVFSVVLVAARLLSHDAVALEAPQVQPDPFYQQKLDANADELPAQF